MPPNNPPLPFGFRPGMLFAALVAAVVVGYSLFAAFPYLAGPALSATAESENGVTRISGSAARVSYLSIDGAPVPIEEDGSFSAVRAYPRGYTAVVVSVTDRFGRTLTKTLSLVTQ